MRGHDPNTSVMANLFMVVHPIIGGISVLDAEPIKEHYGRNVLHRRYTLHKPLLSAICTIKLNEAILKGVSLVECCISWQYGGFCVDTFACEMANDA